MYCHNLLLRDVAGALEFFHDAISRPQAHPIEIFVDALDECKDDDVRRIVRDFEKSAEAAQRNRTSLRICWSSRHYPHVNIGNGLEIRMENENAVDIRRYIEQELRLPEEYNRAYLISLLIQKASGVFLWVVLVVQRLLKASDRGLEQRELEDLLHRIPARLEDHFADILESMDPSSRAKSLNLI